MSAETIFFLDDKMHFQQSAPSIHSASSTGEGFSEAVRDTTFANYWKPSDGTGDEYVQVNGGSAGWLGTTGGDTIYLVVAYDASQADQTVMYLYQDTSDNPAGSFATQRASFTLNTSGPTVDYTTFLLSASGKQYYRLYQFNSGRGGGTRTAKVYAWGMFTASGIINIDVTYGSYTSRGRVDGFSNSDAVPNPSRFLFSNYSGAMQQAFEFNSERAPLTMWRALRDGIAAIGGSARNFYVQYEGLKNAAMDSFAMARLSGPSWNASRPMADDKYRINIPMITAAHR